MKACCAIGLFSLLALLPGSAVLAQTPDIPKGEDVWSTLGGCGNGPETFITFDSTDWQTLCGRSGEDQEVIFTGDPLPGHNGGDTVIARLEDVTFDSSGEASIKVQTKELAFRSVGVTETPCGALTFKVSLSGEEQATTVMYIHRTSEGGGTFDADLEIGTKVTAYNSKGKVVGSVSKGGTLKNPEGGTPWGRKAPEGAANPKAAWYPGVNENGMPGIMYRQCDERVVHAYLYEHLNHYALNSTRAGVPANCPARR